MAGRALWDAITWPFAATSHLAQSVQNCIFNLSVKFPPLLAVRGVGNEYILTDGRHIYDASGGAAVSCIGRYDKRVEVAWVKQFRLGLSYAPFLSLFTQATQNLARFLIESTNGMMSEAVFYGPGKQWSSLIGFK